MNKIATVTLLVLAINTSIASDETKNQIFLNLKVNNRDKTTYIKESEKENEAYDSPGGFGVKYLRGIKQMGAFSLALGLYYRHENEGGVTAKDQDISFGGGAPVRMVKTETEYSQNFYGALAMLSYKTSLYSNFELRPFLGANLGLGKTKATQKIMTDRKKPTIFSTHNRYTLSNDKDFNHYGLVLGTAVESGNWSVAIEGNIESAFSVKSKNNTQIGADEAITFSESDYSFAQKKSTQSIIQIGLGYRF